MPERLVQELPDSDDRTEQPHGSGHRAEQAEMPDGNRAAREHPVSHDRQCLRRNQGRAIPADTEDELAVRKIRDAGVHAVVARLRPEIVRDQSRAPRLAASTARPVDRGVSARPVSEVCGAPHAVPVQAPYGRLRDRAPSPSTPCRKQEAGQLHPSFMAHGDRIRAATARSRSCPPCRQIAGTQLSAFPSFRCADSTLPESSGCASPRALGESLTMIGKLLCHTQVQTTTRYAHLARDSIQTAAARVTGTIGGNLAPAQSVEEVVMCRSGTNRRFRTSRCQP